MSVYRNRYFLAGVLLVLLGVQFRMIHSFVLNEPTTRALAKVTKTASVTEPSTMTDMFLRVHPKPTKQVTPPRWFGLSLIAVGVVISCHALAIPRHSA